MAFHAELRHGQHLGDCNVMQVDLPNDEPKEPEITRVTNTYKPLKPMNCPTRLPIPRRKFLRSLAAAGLGGTMITKAEERQFLRLRLGLPAQPGGRGTDLVRFGIITDTHYGDLDDTPRPRYFRWSLPNLAETVAEFNEANLDFAMHLGDVIQETHSRNASLALLQAMDAEFRKFNGPIHYVPGNHDLADFSKEDFIAHTSGAVGQTHYFFDQGGYRFIVFDACYRADGVSYDTGNYAWTNCFIPPQQIEWASGVLDDAKSSGMRAMAFAHQNFDRFGNSFRIANADAVLAMLASKGMVDAVFSGHQHAGNYELIQGIHVITLVANVDGPDRSAAIIRIAADGTLEVTGVGKRQRNWGPYVARDEASVDSSE